MYYNFKVDIPDVPGKIYLKKIKESAVMMMKRRCTLIQTS